MGSWCFELKTHGVRGDWGRIGVAMETLSAFTIQRVAEAVLQIKPMRKVLSQRTLALAVVFPSPGKTPVPTPGHSAWWLRKV